MANHLRAILEIGPKGKRMVAVAIDWPGLERGATTFHTLDHAWEMEDKDLTGKSSS